MVLKLNHDYYQNIVDSNEQRKRGPVRDRLDHDAMMRIQPKDLRIPEFRWATRISYFYALMI